MSDFNYNDYNDLLFALHKVRDDVEDIKFSISNSENFQNLNTKIENIENNLNSIEFETRSIFRISNDISKIELQNNQINHHLKSIDEQLSQLIKIRLYTKEYLTIPIFKAIEKAILIYGSLILLIVYFLYR